MQIDTLHRISAANIAHGPFPLREILEDSLYYPGSGVDGTPIRNWSLGVNSFVYVDLSLTQESYLRAMSEQPVRGYHIVAQRAVRQQELTPSGYSSVPPVSMSRQDYEMAMRINRAGPDNAFAVWSVLERDQDRDDTFGPERFSLLHVRAEGVAAYAALYLSNGCMPRILAFVRPGLAFGGNYGSFELALMEVMERSPRGVPPQLLWEHATDEAPSLHEPRSRHYRRKIQGPLKRDECKGSCVSLLGVESGARSTTFE